MSRWIGGWVDGWRRGKRRWMGEDVDRGISELGERYRWIGGWVRREDRRRRVRGEV